MERIFLPLLPLLLVQALAGCAVVSVVDTAVGVTATAVGATVDVAGAAVGGTASAVGAVVSDDD